MNKLESGQKGKAAEYKNMLDGLLQKLAGMNAEKKEMISKKQKILAHVLDNEYEAISCCIPADIKIEDADTKNSELLSEKLDQMTISHM